MIGGLGTTYENATHGALAYALNGRDDISLATSVDIQLDYYKLSWTIAIVLMGLLCLMSVLVVGIGAVRSRFVPTWVGVLLIAAPFPIFFAGSGVVIALSGIPLAVGMYQMLAPRRA